jgi:hypothetical protein
LEGVPMLTTILAWTVIRRATKVSMPRKRSILETEMKRGPHAAG